MGGVSMTAPRIVRRDGATVLTFPFDRWLVDALKAEIPGYARTYDPDTRAWTVTPAYAGVAIPAGHVHLLLGQERAPSRRS